MSSDKKKQGKSQEHIPFRHESKRAFDDVVESLTHLSSRDKITGIVQEMLIQRDGRHLEFQFHLRFQGSHASQVEGRVWEDDQGHVIIEGLSIKDHNPVAFWKYTLRAAYVMFSSLLLLSPSFIFSPHWRSLPLFLGSVLTYSILLLLTHLCHQGLRSVYAHDALDRLIQAADQATQSDDTTTHRTPLTLTHELEAQTSTFESRLVEQEEMKQHAS